MKKTDLKLDAIRIEGSLFPTEFIHKLLELKADHQGAEDYDIPPGIQLRDDIGRYWRIASTLWGSFKLRRQRGDAQPPEVGLRHWLVPFFTRVLGFAAWTPVAGETLGDRPFPLTHKLGATPLLLIPYSDDLDKGEARYGAEGRRRSPHAALQEYLNASPAATWGLVSNGLTLRILRDNPSLTRPAYLEADLARIFEEEIYADFVALWLIAHASRFGSGKDDPASARPILERWHAQAQETGERALAKLREGVTTALRQLGNGFLAHPANTALRQALARNELQTADYFKQLLRLVYRLILLLTAEDRGLLHHPEATPDQRALYAQGYSASRLRERALKGRADRHADLWEGLLVSFHGLAVGAAPLGLPALGGIFNPDRCPDLDAAALPNQHLLAALRALCFFRAGAVLARVNYRDMDTEELGSVYESLLELQPVIQVETNPWRFGFLGDEAAATSRGSARKLTGSFYTPDELVQEAIKSGLEPVIARALQAPHPRAALLAIKALDPATGSGHFLLAIARRIAAEIARLDVDGDIPEALAYRHALREVVAHCIHGVDLNPLAVELCQIALWLETLEPGKPLGFLDHRIRHGNSLVGVLDPAILANGIPDQAYTALSGDDKALCSALKKSNRKQAAGRQRDLFGDGTPPRLGATLARLEAMPEDSLEAIGAKRAAYEQAERDEHLARERLRYDLYCAAFFAPKTPATAAIIPLSVDLTQVALGASPRPGVAEYATRLARQQRYFHWPLVFPEVFAAGGFDVILTNQPWERIKLQEQEFFGARRPEIAAAPNAAARGRLIQALTAPGASPADQRLYRDFLTAKREAEGASLFAHVSGRYPLTGVGDVNLYALFAETIVQLIGQRGRASMIVPTGIATDDSTKAFFDSMIGSKLMASIFSFENEELIFPGVHHAFKFCLVALGRTECARFVFFARRIEHIRDERRTFSLESKDIALLNPNTRTCPIFRSQADADITKKIYRRVPVLIDERKGSAGNPWGITFMRMMDMSNDSGHFRTAEQLRADGAERDGMNWSGRDGEIWVPLYEAKMVHQFDHRWATYEENGSDSRDMTDAEKGNPAIFAQPRYWISESELEDRLAERQARQWLMGWRDITNATNERTVIAGVLPRVGVGHTYPLFFSKLGDAQQEIMLLGNFNSIVFDFIARQKVGGTHLTYGYLKQFPTLPPNQYDHKDMEFITSRIIELIYTSYDLAPFAKDLGYNGPPFSWDPDRRALLRAELDVYYAHLYGLNRDELRYIIDPTDVYGEDYPSETFRVLKNSEVRQFDEYRSRRLILEAWDRLPHWDLN